jgi:hypothetical protein
LTEFAPPRQLKRYVASQFPDFMTSDDPVKEVADLFVGLCLQKLIELGHVEREQVNGRWYVEFNETKLMGKGFGGATTLDPRNQPVVYLLPQLNVQGLMFVIAHEAVHLMQICKGELIPGFGFSIWRGQEYLALEHDHPEYFEAQPWEKEARELEGVLLEHLKSNVPSSQ